MNTDLTKCIHCHACRDNCAFLGKYNIDIGDAERLRELAMSCFLCGTCSSVCPVEIDGRAAVLGLRRERAEQGDPEIHGRGYKGLLWEKKDYKFRNYRHAVKGTVLFPGCNFPSMYPKTMKLLGQLLMDKAGIGTAYDCCGKPVGELGLADDEQQIIDGINARLSERGITEVIMVCPNCYYHLKDRLDASVVSIYDKLGIGENIEGGRVYMPCPDRQSREMLDSIGYFCDGEMIPIDSAQCCGLGGSAGVREPELASGMTDNLAGEDGMYVYCASCAGKCTRGGVKDVRHILTEILGTFEKPDTGKSAVNRALTRFK